MDQTQPISPQESKMNHSYFACISSLTQMMLIFNNTFSSTILTTKKEIADRILSFDQFEIYEQENVETFLVETEVTSLINSIRYLFLLSVHHSCDNFPIPFLATLVCV